MGKFCTKCGAELTKEAGFCVKCGHKIEVEQPTPTEPAPQQTQTPPPPPQPTQPATPTHTSAIKPPSKTLKYVGVIVVVAILILASFYVGTMFGEEKVTKTTTGGSRDIGITTTTSVPVTSGSVGYNGGSISVTDSSSPLFGFNIEVPQAAAEDSVNFDISYSDIINITGLPANTNFASKMITIETDGTDVWDKYKSFEKPCTVTLPYDPSLVTNEEAVRFYSYDGESGRLESTGFISQDTDANTITFYAGTFSNFTAIELMMSAYEWFGANYEVDTGFRPATDGWFIDNWGSFLRSGGNCLGMTSYAKWYYSHKKETAGDLYGRYKEGDLEEWRDDETAIELATRCQMGSSGIWSSLTGDEREWATTKSEDVAYSIIHGMSVSGEPQLVGLRTRHANGSFASGGHAVLAYQYTGGRFDICDPNYHGTAPGTDVRQIPFTYNDGFTRVYSSGQNAGSGRQYNIFYHASTKTFSPANAYEQLFEGAEDNFDDNSIFPEVKLTDSSTTPSGNTPIDSDGDNIRDTAESTCTISGTISGGQEEVGSTLVFVSGQKFVVPVNGGSFSQEIPLYAGENDVIILATDENTRTNWAGFLRDTIESTASKASLTLTMTWGQDNSDVDLHVLEPTINGSAGRHIYYSNKGYAGSGNPYLDIDNTWGYGPEHYYATNDMTLPNYAGTGKWLYGTYKFRVHYYADSTQPITWQVKSSVLTFEDEDLGIEYWEDNSWSGSLSTASSSSTSNFQNSGSSWSTIYEIVYETPDPADYGVPPPPQNNLPD